jgi:hypothetical protein
MAKQTVSALVILLGCGGDVLTRDAALVDAGEDVRSLDPSVSCVTSIGPLACSGNNWGEVIPPDAGIGDFDAPIACDQRPCEPGWVCIVFDGGLQGVCE